MRDDLATDDMRVTEEMAVFGTHPEKRSSGLAGGLCDSLAWLRASRKSSVRRPEWTSTGSPAPPRPRLRWWREVLYIVVIYGVYSTVRNQFGSAGGPEGGRSRVRWLVADFKACVDALHPHVHVLAVARVRREREHAPVGRELPRRVAALAVGQEIQPAVLDPIELPEFASADILLDDEHVPLSARIAGARDRIGQSPSLAARSIATIRTPYANCPASPWSRSPDLPVPLVA